MVFQGGVNYIEKMSSETASSELESSELAVSECEINKIFDNLLHLS